MIGASRSGAKGDATSGLALDLSDPASIRRAVTDFAASHARLDGLINAAGAVYWKPATTAFGVDRTWAVNYLGHVLLTRELWPLLEAAPRARVATVAGNPRFLRSLTCDPAALTTTPRDGLRASGEAMAARVIWTHTLARKKRDSRVTVLAFHPGLVRSNLVSSEAPLFWRLLGGAMNSWASSTCEIATTAAVDPALDDESGRLIDPALKVHHFAQLEDAALGERLWTETERLLARG